MAVGGRIAGDTFQSVFVEPKTSVTKSSTQGQLSGGVDSGVNKTLKN